MDVRLRFGISSSGCNLPFPSRAVIVRIPHVQDGVQQVSGRCIDAADTRVR